jgi:hypothetical protein
LEDTVDAFTRAFASTGYALCNSPEYELGYQKVAFYASGDDRVLHVARQHLITGRWLSKLGVWEDISHGNLHSLEGDPSAIHVALGSYGKVRRILKRSWWEAFKNYDLFRASWASFRFCFYRWMHPSWIWNNVTRVSKGSSPEAK